LNVIGAVNVTGDSPAGNNFVLRQSNGNLQVLNHGNIVDSRPLAAVTGFTATGVATAADSLTLDLVSGGYFTVNGPITFQAGGGGPDALGVTGGTLVRDTSTGYTGPNSGSLALNPVTGQPQLVNFTGTTTVDLSGSALTNLNLQLTPGDDQVALTDGGTG